METFSNYGFNKSHSTGYGLVVYWTAFLKAHYPAEYMASHLTTVMDSSEEVAKYVGACQAMGLEVSPPSVNRSGAEFGVDAEGAITYGLAAIREHRPEHRGGDRAGTGGGRPLQQPLGLLRAGLVERRACLDAGDSR
jgi:DNA polymerase III alpha subunit